MADIDLLDQFKACSDKARDNKFSDAEKVKIYEECKKAFSVPLAAARMHPKIENACQELAYCINGVSHYRTGQRKRGHYEKCIQNFNVAIFKIEELYRID